MNSRQIYNLFSFAGMMLLSNEIYLTSPDYLEEKCILFLGKIGKDEFIKYPDNWAGYCEIWGIDKDNYRLMNVMNYLMSVKFYEKNTFINNFEIYFGSDDSISCEDLRCGVHSILLDYLDNKVVVGRYLKLKALE